MFVRNNLIPSNAIPISLLLHGEDSPAFYISDSFVDYLLDPTSCVPVSIFADISCYNEIFPTVRFVDEMELIEKPKATS